MAIMVIGFSWLGWTLGSSAERVAQQRTELAVTSALTPICVQNFMKQSDAGKKLNGGPAQGVASACAEALVKTKV